VSTAQVSLNHDKETPISLAVPVNRYWAFASIAVLGCVADLVSKQWVFQSLGLPGGPTFWLFEPYVGIQTAVNQGALFGMGQGFSRVFALLSVAAAAGVTIWLFYFRAAQDWLLTVALAGVMAGIGGHLYDRLGMWHDDSVHTELKNGVRDWILFQHPSLGTWPNFNIADCLLVCGAGLLMYHAFKRPRSQTAS